MEEFEGVWDYTWMLSSCVSVHGTFLLPVQHFEFEMRDLNVYGLVKT